MSEQQEMKTYEVKARHEVDITYRVKAAGWDDAVKRLCNIELFDDQGNNLFGPCERTMERHGIDVVDTDCYGDPGPTGTGRYRRDWVVEEIEDEDE
jgi:hypothetical protein